MNREPFVVDRKINIALKWYGSSYSFKRRQLNKYREPLGDEIDVQEIVGIYHSSQRNFIELMNTEGASVKSKLNKGIICSSKVDLEIQQGDKVVIDNIDFYVTAIEPVLYNNVVIAQEISLEELVEGND
jgi:hypothetical protein